MTNNETPHSEIPDNETPVKLILEALLTTSREPISPNQMAAVFPEDAQPSKTDIGQALEELAAECEGRAVELKEVASGFRYQVRALLAPCERLSLGHRSCHQ